MLQCAQTAIDQCQHANAIVKGHVQVQDTKGNLAGPRRVHSKRRASSPLGQVGPICCYQWVGLQIPTGARTGLQTHPFVKQSATPCRQGHLNASMPQYPNAPMIQCDQTPRPQCQNANAIFKAIPKLLIQRGTLRASGGFAIMTPPGKVLSAARRLAAFNSEQE